VIEIIRRGRERIAHRFAWRRPRRRGAGHLGGEQAREQGGGLRRCHAFARTPRFVTALRRRVCRLTRHRQLTTARHAAAFRAKAHARCNRQGCATCGGRCRGGQAWRAMSVLRLVEWRISTRAAGPRDRHARRGTHRQQHGSVPPIHRRGVCLCFLAAFGMRSGQLTMRSSRSASATSSSHAPTRPRTEIPAWCTVSGSPETSGCHQ
jgi:hypothetical protein